MDITREEVQDDAKRKALNIIHGALELAGLNPDDYNLSLQKKTKIKMAPNIQVFQTAAYLAATSLTPSANKILMYFLSLSEFENFISIDQMTIHEKLSMSLSSSEKGIKELCDNGIIIKIKHVSDKRRNDYYLNPMQAWKGKTLNRKIAMEKINNEDPSQLHLFGETVEQCKERESLEIKKKRPNLFELLAQGVKPQDLPKL
jgi:DNA-binding MarR family transcriptional regulator